MPKYHVVFTLISKSGSKAGGIMIEEEGDLSFSDGDAVISDKDGIKNVYARGHWEHITRVEE